MLDAGDQRYVVDLRLWGKGRRSGLEVEQRFAFLYELGPDGKVTHACLFGDRATAITEAERRRSVLG